MAWRSHNEVTEDKTAHVWPTHDEREHDTESTDCWCEPRLGFSNDSTYMTVGHRDALDRLALE